MGKEILIKFNCTVSYSGFGIATATGNFSNLKLIAVLTDGTELLLYDGSTDNTDRTFQSVALEAGATPSLKIQFHTTDTVSLSNIFIPKPQTVVSRIVGIDSNGAFHQASMSTNGDLTIIDNASGLSIAQGNVTGSSPIQKFGKAVDYDTADGFVTIWDGADDANINQMQYQYSATANIDSVISSSASDTFSIEIQGLDSDWNLVTQNVTLTGQTRVALTTSLIRVFRMLNDNGSDNVGHVYCYTDNSATTAGVPDDPTTVRAVIQPGKNQTLMAVYSVPANKTAYILLTYADPATSSKSSNYEVEFRVRPFGKVFNIKDDRAISDTYGGYQRPYKVPLKIDAKSDIEMRVKALASNITQASTSGGFDIVLVDN